MKTTDSNPESCNQSLKLLGDYWTLRIVDSLKNGEMRYCQLQRETDNINPVTLTDRLKKLEDNKLIIRVEESLNKLSVVYSLSELGREALPVIAAIDRFSARAKSQPNVTRP